MQSHTISTRMGQQTEGRKGKHDKRLYSVSTGKECMRQGHIGLRSTRVNNFSELWDTVGRG